MQTSAGFAAGIAFPVEILGRGFLPSFIPACNMLKYLCRMPRFCLCRVKLNALTERIFMKIRFLQAQDLPALAR